ncbi:MAG TPA: DinB family protein [Terriglobales bacterium]|nr:DinB family protein [Terriglobales bacterium]
MMIAQSMLPEFDHEMANTRKALERVLDEKFGWKPHEKSPTMGWLAGHLANIPSWVKSTLESDSLDLEPAGGEPPRTRVPANRAEVLKAFDENVKAAREKIAATSDAQMMENWSLLKRGQKLMTLPKVAVLRTWVMNHNIHHRAQLGVYLRLNDVPVPAIYGPSADEAPF